MSVEDKARYYRIGDLAARVGVSVRLLHHYDRLGVVRPSARSEADYRHRGNRPATTRGQDGHVCVGGGSFVAAYSLQHHRHLPTQP